MKTILLTGATGYIGSHTWVELLSAGFNVVGFDNFCNSNPKVLERIEMITGKKPVFVQGDVRDRATLDKLFTDHKIDGAVHFAALKAVGESVAKPLTYYDNNLNGLLNVLSVMGEHDCKCFVFSSSATVYGDPESVPINEQAKLQPTNPYGRTKLMSEEILRDLEVSDPKWRIAYLRYFNPSGAHESGLIGEDPKGIPNNLSPLVARVASGRMEKLMVYGNDWATPDGTGVRDYIHVVDLALGHVKAIEYLLNDKPSLTVNLGTGQGYSVLDLISTYAKASSKPIPYEIINRRPGDIATCYADTKLALDTLGWKAERDLEKMCADGWKWQDINPKGFDLDSNPKKNGENTKEISKTKLNLENFENLGYNCEFGFILQHNEIKESTLFLWTSTPVDALISMFDSNFEDVFLKENLKPVGEDFVRDTKHNIGYHTSLRSTKVGERFEYTEDVSNSFDRIYGREKFSIDKLITKFKKELTTPKIYVRTLKYKEDGGEIDRLQRAIIPKIHPESKLLLLRPLEFQGENLPNLFPGVHLEYFKKFAAPTNEYDHDEWQRVLSPFIKEI